jgi:hypothetical protein
MDFGKPFTCRHTSGSEKTHEHKQKQSNGWLLVKVKFRMTPRCTVHYSKNGRPVAREGENR